MSLIPVAYAEEFDINGYTVIAHNPHVTDITLDWGSGELPSGTITFDKLIKDNFILEIPKEMPRTTNVDFGFGLYAIQFPRHAELEIRQFESDCSYFLEIPVRNSNKIEISAVSVAAGRTVTESDKGCEAEEKHLQPLKEQVKNYNDGDKIICPNPDHVLVQRSSMKWACVYEESAKYLFWDIVKFMNVGDPKITTQVFAFENYHDITYQSPLGDVKSMEFFKEAHSLLIHMQNTKDGKMNVIGSDGYKEPLGNNCNNDGRGGDYMVLVDGEEFLYQQSTVNKDLKLSFEYPENTKEIEILFACIP